MPRPKRAHKVKIVPIVFPVAVDTAMRQVLFNETRGRVPGGAISEYVVSVVKRDLQRMSSGDLLDDLLGESNGG